MNKTQIALIIILAACGVLGFALLIYEWDARQIPPLVTAEQEIPHENEVPAITAPPREQPDQGIQPQNILVMSEEEKTNSTASKSIGPNTIIIRGKAFPYKNNVDEATLKKNIGWMDSSARPGEQGICIFMGHRNGQLRILKDVQYGNVITIVDEHNAAHAYPHTLQFHELHPFPDHPFQVRQDEELYKLADSIREHGLAEPILCRPSPEGEGYQIISGHRRVEACRLAGVTDIPVSVREMDDDLAILVMVDANLHREKILPSDTDLNKKQYVFY